MYLELNKFRKLIACENYELMRDCCSKMLKVA